MLAPYSGRCLCGATRYRLAGEPLIVYACHCTDCQKRSGGAFGISMWVERSAIEVIQGEAVLHVGTTETRSAQPWFAFPEGVPRYETQPKDIFELTR